MTDALVSVYVRPEGMYITASDRTTVGLWVESDDWEFVQTDEPARIGEAILRRLEHPPRMVAHPGRDKFSTARDETIAPLVDLAGVRTWKAFAASMTLVQVDRGTATTVTPMRRDGRGFSPAVPGGEQLQERDPQAIGLAVLRAAAQEKPEGRW
jgi:hypothetical protein